MLAERVRGALWGLLVGDALGVPYEFHLPSTLPPRQALEMTPPPGFARAHLGTPPGTWSDDGAHALCLLASLLHCRKLDLEDLMRRMVNWYEHGYLAVDGRVFDVGIQTGKALGEYRRGVPALEAGPAGEQDNGNGALMRVMPLALWHRGSDEELVHDAALQSRVTHGHLRSQVACGLYCLWARHTLRGDGAAWITATTRLRALYPLESPARRELELQLRPDSDERGSGSGYVVDCLRSARWAVAQGPYEDVVKAAISLGRDTDTTACVAAGIAGARDGVAAIPTRWMHGLRGREDAEPLIEGLVADLLSDGGDARG